MQKLQIYIRIRQELLHPALWCWLCKQICVPTQPLRTSVFWTVWVGSRQHVSVMIKLGGVRNVKIHLVPKSSEVFQEETLTSRNANFDF